VSPYRVPGRPRDALADGEQAGGKKERVEQDAKRHRRTDLGNADFGDLGERGEGARQDDARRRDHSAGDADRTHRAGAQAAGIDFLSTDHSRGVDCPYLASPRDQVGSIR
jgi:hypothetical protein